MARIDTAPPVFSVAVDAYSVERFAWSVTLLTARGDIKSDFRRIALRALRTTHYGLPSTYYATMPLAELRVFEWRGTGRTEQIVPRPSLKAVLAAVRALDGAAHNDMYLYPKAGAQSYLCVGGGAGKYLLTGVLPGDRFPTLIDPTRPDLPKQPLRVGGQEGLYPRNWIHPLEVTLRAVEEFWNTGEFGGAGLTWGEP